MPNTKTHTRDVYDIDLDIEDLLGTDDALYNYFHVQELKQRRLFLQENVDQWSIAPIVKHILQYNIEDKGKPIEERQPILLYISSNGGAIDDGFELIDTIIASRTPVHTINVGYAYSMGFLIMLAGHKRMSMPNAKFLLHDGSNFAWGSMAKIRDQIEFQKRIEERIRSYVIERTSITPEEYDAKYRVEWYMFANEAKENGVIDSVVGIDVDLDYII